MLEGKPKILPLGEAPELHLASPDSTPLNPLAGSLEAAATPDKGEHSFDQSHFASKSSCGESKSIV